MYTLLARFGVLVLTALLVACGGGEQRSVIQNKGSDTLVNVAQAWAETYQTVDSSVVVAVSGGGSGTGIAALINGTVDIANASRAMKDSEREQARGSGQDPVQHIVGYDALAVFLHADNPIDTMDIETLQGIYGDGGELTLWTDLGVEVPGLPGSGNRGGQPAEQFGHLRVLSRSSAGQDWRISTRYP